jgi:UDP-2,3-diacylglucosamine hydrolase
MSCVVISDVHVVEPQDKNSKILMSFFRNDHVQHAENIILLGDIFDVLVGGYKQYYLYYQEIFDQIIELINSGKKVYFLEGNHDFLNSRLEKVINSKTKVKNFHVVKRDVQLKIGDKTYLFEHGDDVEIDNFNYQVYKFFINNKLMDILTRTLIPYSFVRKLGSYMSKKSRDYSSARFGEELKAIIKNKFRESARLYREKRNFDFLILGHSHIQDYYEGDRFTYINNGFAGESKTFILIKEGMGPEFISL